MMKAGISQRTWKWIPSLLICDQSLTTVRMRKPKMTTARPTCSARRTPLLRGGLVPNRAPASPIRWRSGCFRSTGSRLVTFWDSPRMGEVELLALPRERLPAAGPQVRLGSGDDAAITVPGGATATSVDALVEGVHFRRGTSSLRQIGRKALSTALSDLAAMGAEPGEAYV